MFDNKSLLQDIIRFIDGYGEYINIYFLGDNFTQNDIEFILQCFKDINTKYSNNIKFRNISISNIFKGDLKNIKNTKNSIFYLDKNLSADYLDIFNNNTKYVDELDAMLIKHHLFDIKHKKIILDISHTDNNAIKYTINNLDQEISIYNYYITNNYLALTTI